MYTLRTFLVLTLATISLAAPEGIPPECVPPTPIEKEIEASKCCKMVGIMEEASKSIVGECLELVKDKPVKGAEKKDGPRPVLKPEGFDCMDDCIMTKLNLLANKKIDTDKIVAAAKAKYTDDWATVGPKLVNKCLEQVATDEKKECPTSGADNFVKCLFRETYLNCPAKSWTESDVCKANKERLLKCPKALPFCAHRISQQQ